MKKRLEAIGLVAVFVLINIMPLTISAAEIAVAVIEIGTITGKTGETVSVPVNISGNPTVSGYEITVLFDSGKLQYTGFTENNELFPKPSGTNITVANAKGKVSLIGANLKGLSKVDKDIPDGVLVMLNFKILTVSDDVTLNITDINLINSDNDVLQVRALGGKVMTEKSEGNNTGTGDDGVGSDSIKDNPGSSLPKDPVLVEEEENENEESGEIGKEKNPDNKKETEEVETKPEPDKNDGSKSSSVYIPVNRFDSSGNTAKDTNDTTDIPDVQVKSDLSLYILPANIKSIIPDFSKYQGVAGIKLTISDNSAKYGKIPGALSGIVAFKLELLNDKTEIIAEITDFGGKIEKIIPIGANIKKPNYWGVQRRKNQESEWEFAPAKWTEKGVLVLNQTNGEYVVVEYKPVFKDVPKNAWYYENITMAASKLLVKGTNAEGTLYNPENQVTRAEFTTMIVRALSLPTAKPGTGNYGDIKTNDWFYDAAIRAKSAGLLTGLEENNEFKPNEPMLREEMAYVLAKAAEYAKIETDRKIVFSEKFTDSTTVSAKYISSVEKTVSAGLMEGMSISSFDGQGKVTRAQAATILVRLTKLLNFID